MNLILDIEPRTLLNQHLRHIEVTRANRLVERRGVSVCAGRIETIGVLAGIDQDPDDLGMAQLRR